MVRPATFTALLLLFGSQSAAAQNTFLYLVRQWPYSYCDTSSCSKSPSGNWGIHGLWPEYTNGGYPSSCNSQAFSQSQVQDLVPRMNSEWQSLTGANSDFWSHEWSKHGTCTGSSQHTYFQGALDLNEDYSIDDALNQAGITPGGTVNTADIGNALASAWGLQNPPVVQCSQGYITQIYMCVDDNYNIQDCEDACPSDGCQNTNCQSGFYPSS